MDALNDELETTKALAVQAGAILLKHFAEKTSVRWKGKDNPVTDADQSASRFIVFNNPLRYNTTAPEHLDGLIASNGVLHDRAVEAARAVLVESGRSS